MESHHVLTAKEVKQMKKNQENEFKHDALANYSLRKLDQCGVCKEQYNVGERIPRILVNCGHTYCTSCLSKYYREFLIYLIILLICHNFLNRMLHVLH